MYGARPGFVVFGSIPGGAIAGIGSAASCDPALLDWIICFSEFTRETSRPGPSCHQSSKTISAGRTATKLVGGPHGSAWEGATDRSPGRATRLRLRRRRHRRGARPRVAGAPGPPQETRVLCTASKTSAHRRHRRPQRSYPRRVYPFRIDRPELTKLPPDTYKRTKRELRRL